jgi:hypothetical protein
MTSEQKKKAIRFTKPDFPCLHLPHRTGAGRLLSTVYCLLRHVAPQAATRTHPNHTVAANQEGAHTIRQ